MLVLLERLLVVLLTLGIMAASAAACGGGGAAATSLKTSLSGGGKEGEEISVSEGSGVKDTATLSGENASKATGTVKYAVYSDKECKTLVTTAGEVTVKEGKVPASEEKKLEAGAVYYWQAVYSGDTNNSASTSTCGKEVLTVKATTSLKTSLSGGGKEGEEITVSEGTGVKDTATLSGTKSSTATGSVEYALYKDKECKELVSSAGKGALTEGKAAASEEEKPEAGAVYYWKASYVGDSLHEGTSACGKEVLTVKATTSLSTSLSGGGKEGEAITVAEGTGVKDTATLSGTKSSTATGNVEYALYKDKECKELVSSAGKGALEGGKAASSEEEKPEAAAIYYWKASYVGDSLHEGSESACGKEVLTVKATTTLKTTLSGGGEEGEKITVTEGTKVKDQATLSGTKSGTAKGTITYAVYKDEECKELATKAGEGEVKEGKAPASEEKELEAGSIYYWRATYEGDGLHEASKSTCGKEVLNVKAATTLSTSLKGGGKEGEEGEKITVTEGTKVKDQATLSGTKSGTAKGTITYAVYKDEECKELATKAGEGEVKEGKAPASEEKELEAAAIYYWRATYEGDGLHEASESDCTETSIVKATTSLTTLLTDGKKEEKEIKTSENVKVRDQAVLSGTHIGNAEGAVLYFAYSDEECKELAGDGGEVSVENGEVTPSEGLALPAGTYYWQAVYYGDLLHEESTSSCGDEVETVKVAALSLTTSLAGEEQSGDEIEVQEESAVVDTASIKGEGALSATGSVEYNVYADEECENLVAEAGSVPIEEGSIPPSEGLTLSAGATYYWQARYLGDLSHEGASSVCGTEIERVAQDTFLTTSLTAVDESGEEIETGTNIKVKPEASVSDTATISGEAAEEATGTLEYNIYLDSECTELYSAAGTVELEPEGEVPPSRAVILPPGTYYWQASYFGDAANKGSDSLCGIEIETVALEVVTTELEAGGKSGTEIEVANETPVSATANLDIENAATATGSVEYQIYSDDDCQETVGEPSEVTVEEGNVPPSAEFELSEGTYYWLSSYSGDGEHEPVAGVCGEAVELAIGATSLATVLSGGEESGAEIQVPEGTSVVAAATLSGTKSKTAGGTASYVIYSDSKCTNVVADAGEAAVSGGSIKSSSSTRLPAGTYYWEAAYSGDPSNGASVSVCGAAVEKVSPGALTTTLSGGGETGQEIKIEPGAEAADKATFHIENASTATGTVDYIVYSDKECKGESVKTFKVNVESGGVIPSSPKVELPGGTYYWQAVYSGDGEHPGAASVCGMEVLQVPSSWIVSVGDSYISGEGGIWAGNAVFNQLGRLTHLASINALGDGGYNDNPFSEKIPLCHRSRSAEVDIQETTAGAGVASKNFACSGAETKSRSFQTRGGTFFKPGLDFETAVDGEVIPNSRDNSRCPPLTICKGQTLQLEEFAKELMARPRPEKIRTVVVSIGGNDFEFGDVVEKCVRKFLGFEECRNDPDVKAPFEGARRLQIRGAIEVALAKVGEALRRADYNPFDTYILVQDYPSPLGAALGAMSRAERSFLFRCPFADADAAWADATASAVINQTVREAEIEVSRRFLMRFLQLRSAFNGRRLCDGGLTLADPFHPWWRLRPMEWVNQVRLIDALGAPFMLQEDFHPNFFGQLALRNCLRRVFGNGATPNDVGCARDPVGMAEEVAGAGVRTMSRGRFTMEPTMQLTPP